jgi:hypothetical protein
MMSAGEGNSRLETQSLGETKGTNGNIWHEGPKQQENAEHTLRV